MLKQKRKGVWAIALGLALLSTGAGRAGADAIRYSTTGGVSSPDGLVSYVGLTDATATLPGSINLGQFVIAPGAISATTSYVNDPFQVALLVGGDKGALVTGTINGMFGPASSNPGLTATISTISPIGTNALPFNLSLPIGTPLALAMTDGVTAAPTALVGTATVPEPASILVFAATLGGLGIWKRRRLAR